MSTCFQGGKYSIAVGKTASPGLGVPDSKIVENLFTAIRRSEVDEVFSNLICMAALHISFDMQKAEDIAASTGNEEILKRLAFYKKELEYEREREQNKNPLNNSGKSYPGGPNGSTLHVLRGAVEELTVVNDGLRQEIEMLKAETEKLKNALQNR